MAALEYRNLQGMKLEFVSGELRNHPEESLIEYEVTFKLFLDFTHFREEANAWIPDFIESGDNSIRPALAGMAAFGSYIGVPASVTSAVALFAVIDNSGDYAEGWFSSPGIETFISKPSFSSLQSPLLITALRKFRHITADGQASRRPITIKDLPLMIFEWLLVLFEARDEKADVSPLEIVELGYMAEKFVQVGGVQLREGTLYLDPLSLRFGVITADQVLPASAP